METRAASIKYAKAKNSRSRQKECILENDIWAIEKLFDQQHLPEVDKESLNVAVKIKRQEIEKLSATKWQGRFQDLK